jgi:hypothetical protein
MYINRKIIIVHDLIKLSETTYLKNGSKNGFWFSYSNRKFASVIKFKRFSKIKEHSSETGKY